MNDIKRLIQIDKQRYKVKPNTHQLDKNGEKLPKIDKLTGKIIQKRVLVDKKPVEIVDTATGEVVHQMQDTYWTEMEGVQGRLKKTKAVEVDTTFLKDAIKMGRTVSTGVITLGSRKDEDFIEANFLFADIDDGFTMQSSLDKCLELGLKPFLIYPTFSYTESKEKHRICFALENTITDKEVYSSCLRAFIDLFGSDTKAVNAARIYYGTNKQEFYFAKDDVLTAEQVQELNLRGIEYRKTHSTKSDIDNAVDKANRKHKLAVIAKDIAETHSEFRTKLEEVCKELIVKLTSYSFTTFQELYDRIDKMDLTEIFGDEAFLCVFHEESKESAKIMTEGVHIYSCLGCGLSLAPIHFLALYYGVAVNEVIKTIMAKENVKVISKELKDQNELVQNRVLGIFDNEIKNHKEYKPVGARKSTTTTTKAKEFKKMYPKLTVLLSKNHSLLVHIAKYKQLCLLNCPMTDEVGEHIFYMALDTIKADMGLKTKTGIKVTMDLLALTELVVKVDDSRVPAHYLKESKTYCKDKSGTTIENGYTTQYYSIPFWSIKVLKRAEQLLNEWKEGGHKGRNHTSAVMIKSGVDVGKVIPKSSVTNSGNTLKQAGIEEVMMAWSDKTIKRKGVFLSSKFNAYATSKTVVGYAPLKDKDGAVVKEEGAVIKVKQDCTVTLDDAKKALPVILARLNLKEVTCTLAHLKQFKLSIKANHLKKICIPK